MAAHHFEFPADFNAMFQKEYVVSGNSFTIQVQEMPMLTKEKAGAHACFVWAFRILVNGNNIVEGPYYWSVDKRRLNLENVANHLASFWGHSETVEVAQGLAENNEEALNVLVFKCADWMHTYMMQEEAFRDFEIINKFMDSQGWHIMLSPNYRADRIFEFSKNIGEGAEVNVAVYAVDRELKTIL